MGPQKKRRWRTARVPEGLTGIIWSSSQDSPQVTNCHSPQEVGGRGAPRYRGAAVSGLSAQVCAAGTRSCRGRAAAAAEATHGPAPAPPQGTAAGASRRPRAQRPLLGARAAGRYRRLQGTGTSPRHRGHLARRACSRSWPFLRGRDNLGLRDSWAHESGAAPRAEAPLFHSPRIAPRLPGSSAAPDATPRRRLSVRLRRLHSQGLNNAHNPHITRPYRPRQPLPPLPASTSTPTRTALPPRPHTRAPPAPPSGGGAWGGRGPADHRQAPPLQPQRPMVQVVPARPRRAALRLQRTTSPGAPCGPPQP